MFTREQLRDTMEGLVQFLSGVKKQQLIDRAMYNTTDDELLALPNDRAKLVNLASEKLRAQGYSNWSRHIRQRFE